MRKTPYLLAVAAGLALMATSSSASPLASGLASRGATSPALNEGLVQNVQARPCQGKRKDWSPEQRRFCGGHYDYYDRYDRYDRYEDYGPRYGYASPEYGYGYQGYGPGVFFPFIGFGFGGGRHHHSGEWD